MDINLPLILFLAVAGTGIVCLVDLIFFYKKRKLAVAGVESQFDNLSEEEKTEDPKYLSAINQVATEPALIEYSKSFFPVLMLVFVLRSFVIEPFQIPSESMVPTLEVGDFILVNKFAYGIRLPLIRTKVVDISDPKRGDVMVFFPPHEDRYFIKRVVGLPGDVIRYDDKSLYINSVEMAQELDYIDEDNDPRCARAGGEYHVVNENFGDKSHLMRRCTFETRLIKGESFKVPEGHYFMMGDNRDNSSDSRVWGPVPQDRIVGKAFAIWMQWDSFLSIPSFSRVGEI